MHHNAIKCLFQLLVACGLLVPGLGSARDALGAPRPRDAEEVRRVFSRCPAVLDRAYPSHVASALALLKDAARRLAVAPAESAWMTEEQRRERLQAADVVLVADIHSFDVTRIAMSRLLEKLAGEYQVVPVIGTEAVPASCQSIVDAIRRKRPGWDRLGVDDLLKACWPWPVERLARILSRWDSADVLALGGEEPVALPSEDVPDRRRRPESSSRRSEAELRTWYEASTLSAVAQMSDYVLRRGRTSGKKIAALYGIAHVIPMRVLLEARGVRVLVCVPFVPEIDREVLLNHESEYERGWLELGGGCVHPPLVAWSDIVAEFDRE